MEKVPNAWRTLWLHDSSDDCESVDSEHSDEQTLCATDVVSACCATFMKLNLSCLSTNLKSCESSYPCVTLANSSGRLVDGKPESYCVLDVRTSLTRLAVPLV
jgi:hypothetical protein